MSKDKLFEEPEPSSEEEEDDIVDQDTCSRAEIDNAFLLKYKIADETAVSLKNIYVLSLCADNSFTKLAAGLSNNVAQIIDIDTGRAFSRPAIDAFDLNFRGSNCGVKFLDETANCLVTGSTSGDVCLFDLRTGKLEHTFTDFGIIKKKPVVSFDVNANGRVICMGTKQVDHNVFLTFCDVRKRDVMGGYFECHQDDVTNVRFHPTNPDLMLTGSVDGLINVFDISATSEDDALSSTINTESSVHKLEWLKDVYGKDVIACITHSNDFKTYDSAETDLIAEFDRIKLTEAIKRDSYAHTNLVSCHNLADGGIFLLATSNFNRGEVVRSVQMQNRKLLPHADFDGNKQIIRESVYDSKTNLLVTAGESGIVSLWSPSASNEPPVKIGPNKLKAKSKTSKSHAKTPY